MCFLGTLGASHSLLVSVLLPLCLLVSKGGFHCDFDDLQPGVLADMVVFPGGGTEPRLAFFPGSNLAVFALIIAECFFLSRHRDCL